ncbi:MAG: TIGR00296 family protein [Bacteroidetes bacterium HGW-Bacteroidetes-21]|nr:MAG: TIGR00296 family protein [Bacteroidetes bacterium HGW-Bacteroidetes-21]
MSFSQFIKCIVALLLISTNGMGQLEQNQKCMNRKAVVAGQFYPATEVELKNSLKEYFALSFVRPDKRTITIISPHAGYVFSGSVAASAFSAIPPEAEYERIFIITSSHKFSFEGASVFSSGNYETPLGEVIVDTMTGLELIKASLLFSDRTDAHLGEHSLEVQLPFLQYHLKTPFKIVPIIIGTQDTNVCKKIAEVLKSYLKPENLFIISTDFSHYPNYSHAVDADKTVASSLMSNNANVFLDSLHVVESKGTPGLVTGMCGWASVLTYLYMTEGNPDIKYQMMDYKNSGDSKYGDKDKVVGYWAIKIILERQKQEPDFLLTDDDKEDMLDMARKTVIEYAKTGTKADFNCKGKSDALRSKSGAFVTLHKNGELRGCIGQFRPSVSLCELIIDLAISSSAFDHRFPPVSASELDEIDIEISVLTPMRKIDDINAIELGKHGIYIVKGNQSGTFLPQVATETGWTLEEFLGHCARDKAGIGWDGWKKADIYIYEAIIFGEKDHQK